MSKSNAFETDLLNYVFNKTAFSWDSITNLYLSLHTADPGEAGTQATNEATYTSYSRVAVSRSGSGWAVSGDTASNLSLVQFPQCTGGSSTVTHVGIGIAASGAGVLLYSGVLGSALTITNLITPQFSAGVLQVKED